MDRDREARGGGARDIGAQLERVDRENAPVVTLLVRLLERGRLRTERTVGEKLHVPEAKPVIAVAAAHSRLDCRFEVEAAVVFAPGSWTHGSRTGVPELRGDRRKDRARGPQGAMRDPHHDAQHEAAAQMSEASQEASKILHEAEGLQTEAKNASATTRERADAYATKKRQDAEAEALKVLETAEQVAARQHTEMADREKALGARLEFTEKRLRDLVSGLRELAEHLESLLVPGPGGGETLDDALRESVRAESTSDRGA